jgi:1-phosphatidylinositol-3-phosphate 5-kinase
MEIGLFFPSSFDYQRELASMMHPRASLGQTGLPPTPPIPLASSRQNTMSTLGRSSASGSTTSFKFFGSSHKPDPDREDSVWHEPEAYSAVVSRKEHPRDPTALLSLREVLRHKVPVEGPQGSQSSAITSVSRMVNNAAPPSAWAKPAVEVNMAAVDGHVTGMPEAVVTAGRILHELDGASVLSRGSIDSTTSAFVETNIHRGKMSSLLPRASTESDGSTTSLHSPLGDIAVPKAQRATAERALAGLPVGSRSRSSTVSTTHDATGQQEAAAVGDGSMLSWTNSLTSAMRYMLKGDVPSQPATPAANHHHGLLYADPLTIDERPHIRYDWTIGRRLKFSCTVYYARQFDALRRRCGVSEDAFARSMAKCEPWKAQGGKSRSNFWKTSDDRFIIKTLINAWNVADLCVFYLLKFFFRFWCWLTDERCRGEKASTHRVGALLFPAYGVDRESSVNTRETARLLHRRSTQLGNGDRTGKGGSPRDGEPVQRPEADENVRPQGHPGSQGEGKVGLFCVEDAV